MLRLWISLVERGEKKPGWRRIRRSLVPGLIIKYDIIFSVYALYEFLKFCSVFGLVFVIVLFY